MDPDTFRGTEGADVYWRRRVSVLTGVLVVVAVIAWACTSASGKPEGVGRLGQPGPSGPDAMIVSLPSPLASLLSTPTATPTPTAEATLAPGAASAAPAPKPRRPGDPCEPKDVVVSLRSGQEMYAGDAKPAFLLSVVNTGRVECTIDLGPRALELRITSGADRFWSTADCVSGEGKDVKHLQRGIPYVRTVTWDRRRSGEVCGSKHVAARPGTYVAATHMAGIPPDRAVFRLR